MHIKQNLYNDYINNFIKNTQTLPVINKPVSDIVSRTKVKGETKFSKKKVNLQASILLNSNIGASVEAKVTEQLNPNYLITEKAAEAEKGKIIIYDLCAVYNYYNSIRDCFPGQNRYNFTGAGGRDFSTTESKVNVFSGSLEKEESINKYTPALDKALYFDLNLNNLIVNNLLLKNLILSKFNLKNESSINKENIIVSAKARVESKSGAGSVSITEINKYNRINAQRTKFSTNNKSKVSVGIGISRSREHYNLKLKRSSSGGARNNIKNTIYNILLKNYIKGVKPLSIRAHKKSKLFVVNKKRLQLNKSKFSIPKVKNSNRKTNSRSLIKGKAKLIPHKKQTRKAALTLKVLKFKAKSKRKGSYSKKKKATTLKNAKDVLKYSLILSRLFKSKKHKKHEKYMLYYKDKKSYGNIKVLLKKKFRKSIFKYLRLFYFGKFLDLARKKRVRKVIYLKRFLPFFKKVTPKKKNKKLFLNLFTDYLNWKENKLKNQPIIFGAGANQDLKYRFNKRIANYSYGVFLMDKTADNTKGGVLGAYAKGVQGPAANINNLNTYFQYFNTMKNLIKNYNNRMFNFNLKDFSFYNKFNGAFPNRRHKELSYNYFDNFKNNNRQLINKQQQFNNFFFNKKETHTPFYTGSLYYRFQYLTEIERSKIRLVEYDKKDIVKYTFDNRVLKWSHRNKFNKKLRTKLLKRRRKFNKTLGLIVDCVRYYKKHVKRLHHSNIVDRISLLRLLDKKVFIKKEIYKKIGSQLKFNKKKKHEPKNSFVYKSIYSKFTKIVKRNMNFFLFKKKYYIYNKISLPVSRIKYNSIKKPSLSNFNRPIRRLREGNLFAKPRAAYAAMILKNNNNQIVINKKNEIKNKKYYKNFKRRGLLKNPASLGNKLAVSGKILSSNLVGLPKSSAAYVIEPKLYRKKKLYFSASGLSVSNFSKKKQASQMVEDMNLQKIYKKQNIINITNEWLLRNEENIEKTFLYQDTQPNKFYLDNSLPLKHLDSHLYLFSIYSDFFNKFNINERWKKTRVSQKKETDIYIKKNKSSLLTVNANSSFIMKKEKIRNLLNKYQGNSLRQSKSKVSNLKKYSDTNKLKVAGLINIESKSKRKSLPTLRLLHKQKNYLDKKRTDLLEKLNFQNSKQINNLYNHMINSFFNFEIDNKGINIFNKLGLRKVLKNLKIFRYFRFSGKNTGYKKIFTYNFIKNNSRTNTIISLDHTGSLLKTSVSVLLKYFFKLMGLGLISKPVFIFNHNKITIQLSYFINKKIYFFNNKLKSNLLHLMIYNNNSLINEINKINKIKYPYLNFKSNKFLFGHLNNQLQIDRNDLSLSNLDFLNIKNNQINSTGIETETDSEINTDTGTGGVQTNLSSINKTSISSPLLTKINKIYLKLKKKPSEFSSLYVNSINWNYIEDDWKYLFRRRSRRRRRGSRKRRGSRRSRRSKSKRRKSSKRISRRSRRRRKISRNNIITIKRRSKRRKNLKTINKKRLLLLNKYSATTLSRKRSTIRLDYIPGLSQYHQEQQLNKNNIALKIWAAWSKTTGRSRKKFKYTRRSKASLEKNFYKYPLFINNVPFLDIIKKRKLIKNLIHVLSSRHRSQRKKVTYLIKKANSNNIKNTLSYFYNELNSLTYILEDYFNCSIKLELNRLDQPFADSNIMAHLIGINGKNYTFERIKSIFFPNFYYLNPNTLLEHVNLYPKSFSDYISYTSGLKIRVAGRFYLHRIIPRKTVSRVQLGSMARGVIKMVESARYINKSKRGSFSISVWISYTY